MSKRSSSSGNKKLKGKTDLKRLHAMTDKEAYANATGDPDAQPVSRKILKRVRVSRPNIKSIRLRLKMSQKEFAETYQLPLASIRDWEQGRFSPPRAVQTLLKVIAYDHETVEAALGPKSTAAR